MDSFTKSYLMFQLINSNQRGGQPAANNTVARMAVLPASLLLSTSSAPATPNLTSRRQSMAVSRMLSAQIPIGADLNVDEDDRGKSPLARKLSMPATAVRRRTSLLITSPSRSPVPPSLRGSEGSLDHSETDRNSPGPSGTRERPHRRSASCRHPSSRSLSVPEGKKLGPKLSRPPTTLEAVAESAQPGTSGENGDDQEDLDTSRRQSTQVEINISPASSTSRIPSEAGSLQSVSLAAITQPYRRPSQESQSSEEPLRISTDAAVLDRSKTVYDCPCMADRLNRSVPKPAAVTSAEKSQSHGSPSKTSRAFDKRSPRLEKKMGSPVFLRNTRSPGTHLRAAREPSMDLKGAHHGGGDTIGMLLSIAGRNDSTGNDWQNFPACHCLSHEESTELLTTLAYSPLSGHLNLKVIRGRNFPADLDYCQLKVTWIVDGIHGCQKSGDVVLQPTDSPTFNQPFLFVLPQKQTSVATLILSVWGYDIKSGYNELGNIVFGANGHMSASLHWAKMQNSPGLPFPMWHEMFL